jgi:hypothetical protein
MQRSRPAMFGPRAVSLQTGTTLRTSRHAKSSDPPARRESESWHRTCQSGPEEATTYRLNRHPQPAAGYQAQAVVPARARDPASSPLVTLRGGLFAVTSTVVTDCPRGASQRSRGKLTRSLNPHVTSQHTHTTMSCRQVEIVAVAVSQPEPPQTPGPLGHPRRCGTDPRTSQGQQHEQPPRRCADGHVEADRPSQSGA